jgi:hypothetical protein
MDKIYAVVINFEDWESSEWRTIGHFLSLEEAEAVRDKWKGFFDEHCGNIKSRAGANCEDDIGEYYEAYGKYREIKDYAGIEIQEHVLGVDLFSSQDSKRTKEMISLVRQWERDYIIEKITKNK